MVMVLGEGWGGGVGVYMISFLFYLKHKPLHV